MPSFQAVVRVCFLATRTILLLLLPWRLSQTGGLINKVNGKITKDRAAVTPCVRLAKSVIVADFCRQVVVILLEIYALTST